MFSGWSGKADLSEPLFSSMNLRYFEGRKKLFQSLQPIRCGLINQHRLFSQENAE